MDKQALQKLENRCIQDQPAQCVAACPLHVDVRTFIKHVSQGDRNNAWKVLRKTMPVPGILGRICDGPCQMRCKRRDAGGAIRINELEKACVSQPVLPSRILPLPKKGKTVAVAGSGISSLTAAWDLGRKGYDIRLLIPDARPELHLLNLYGKTIPAEIIKKELDMLKSVNVVINTGISTDAGNFLKQCLESHDAVYLGLDAVDGQTWNLPKNREGNTAITPKTQTTGLEGVFAGGLPCNGVSSPVWQAAEGRWAATSIDRFLQKVSLNAGREKEGPYETRLFTSLADVRPQNAAPMTNPDGYTWEEAVEEARRCLQCECMECVKVCPYLERFNGYPKKYAREIYNNESIVMGIRQANKLINSCSLCGLCETVCPENFAMQDICLTARQSMSRRGKMPPSAHEFALMDMAFSQSERFALARHEPGHSKSEHLFFPGCQLCASAPDKILPLYDYLRKSLGGGVGIMLGCCAAPARWAGREDQFQEETAGFEQKWTKLGKPQVITACSTCLSMFQKNLKGISITSLWQVTAEKGLPDFLHIKNNLNPKKKFAVHDPCTTRTEPKIRASVRVLLERMGVMVEELELSNEKTECCGFGGLMENANPELAKEVITRRSARSRLDYIAYCAMCRDALAGSGKRVIHLADLIIPDPDEPDPASRKRPTWSERQENRAKLKTHLLERLWGEKALEIEEYQNIILDISPDVSELLDNRRILTSDIQQVIYHAEKTKDKLRHGETGRFKAAFRPYNTTFWVEYTLSETGYVIHNAYAHRMEVIR